MSKPKDASAKNNYLRPVDIKRALNVSYENVVSWLTVGHPRAGILPSVDLAQPGKRHSFRILATDLDSFLHKLSTTTREPIKTQPLPPGGRGKGGKGMFRY